MKTDTPYYLGAKPDRFDPRDFDFRRGFMDVARARAAAAVDRKMYTMVNPDFRINQGNEGTCVGHASTNLLLAGPSAHKTYTEFETEEKAHQFARRLYLEASGDATYQDGMYPRDACAKLLDWDLIDSYWGVTQVEDIVTALLTFGPLMIAVPWYMSMYYGDNALASDYGNFWIRVNLDSQHVGYHMIALTGVDMAPDNGAPQFVRVQNSWGEGWGWNGTARLTIESLRLINIWDNWTFAEKTF
jgi:hypothetical protein